VGRKPLGDDLGVLDLNGWAVHGPSVPRRPAACRARKVTNSGGTYGSPKIWITLVRKGWRVSVNTIAKIMAELGLAGRKARGRRGLTRPGKRSASPDFVRRDFSAEAPDLVWCGDMTEIETGEGKLYLATVIDLFSRRLQKLLVIGAVSHPASSRNRSGARTVIRPRASRTRPRHANSGSTLV
jgi:short subunit dehydrogenase-like uncharacterized protein